VKISMFTSVTPLLLCAGLGISSCSPAFAIPAFARKYGLPCSACHEAWPKLNNFGLAFRDNGYQLMNDRDAPIYQNPTYFPISFRITPQWHRESTNRVAVDTVPGDATSGLSEAKVISSGFDLSGLDLWTAGTLANNISFLVLPSADATGAFHFEAAWIRFDNLFKSRWLNLKMGKHELDTPISEKRFLALTNNGGFYQLYHGAPVSSDINSFGGIGDNQLGAELLGHSQNSYTRYAVSVLSSNDGQPGLPTNRTYDVYGDFSQAFEVPHLGVQRVGAYGYSGKSPTYYLTSDGQAIPGTGRGDRPFYRAGAYGIWYAGKFDFSTVYMHGKDNVLLGVGTPANALDTLPDGARAPIWNGGFVEAHFTYSPQLVLVGRYEAIRVSQQPLPAGSTLSNGVAVTNNFGNTDAWVGGFRYYPIMTSRAGLAYHMEYAQVRTSGTSPVTGRDVRGSSVMLGFDFAF
jgi:hypothetical protein